VIAARILSVLSAAFLVLAFAIAAFWPPDTPLRDLLDMIDSSWVPALQVLIEKGVSSWLWTTIVIPVLERPGWLPPTAIGLIFFGSAVNFSGPRGSRTRPRRWRS
jgi:hypothetical protein